MIPYDEFVRARAARKMRSSGSERSGDAPRPRDPAEPDRARRKTDRPVPEASTPQAEDPKIDGRAQTVGELRARINEGFYDRPEILEETVRRILLALDARNLPRCDMEMEW